MKKVGLYISVSKNEMETNVNSLSEQKELLLNYVRDLGWDYSIEEKNIYIDEWFEKWERNILKSMMNEVENLDFDILLVMKINRFDYKILPIIDILEKLSNNGIWVKSVSENFNTSDIAWKLTVEIFKLIKEQKNKNISNSSDSFDSIIKSLNTSDSFWKCMVWLLKVFRDLEKEII